MFWKSRKTKIFGETGSVVAEAVICLPIIWMTAMGIAQYAFLQICRQMVVYASFVAARATIPVHETEEYAAALHSARRVCSTISFTGAATGTPLARNWLPQGTIKGSEGLMDAPHLDADGCYRSGKVAVLVSTQTQTPWHRAVTVTMDVPLMFPFAGYLYRGLSGKKMKVMDKMLDRYVSSSNDPSSCYYGYSHIRLYHSTYIGKNNIVMTGGTLPDNYWIW